MVESLGQKQFVQHIHDHVLPQAYALLPAMMRSPDADVLLLAIGLQESGLTYRDQLESNGLDLVDGPAMGLLQFEKLGGVAGALKHHQSKDLTRWVCQRRRVEATPAAVWKALESDDVLAFALGRLLLWTDPNRLPGCADRAGGWACYRNIWRPGKPHPERWPMNHAIALSVVQEAAA